MYRKARLDNGVRIVTHNMPKMQSVAVGVWIKVGARYETAENKGISHYLEHLLFKGSKKYSCRKLKESIEGVGGSLNGFTSEELTCYLAKLPHRYLDLGLDILSDMVINPLLPQEEVEKERTVILEELKMYKDLPQSYVYDLLDELLWPKQILGMSVIGSVKSINAIKREDLHLFQKRYYSPFNIVVSAVGLLDNDRLIKRTGRIFSHLKDKNVNKFIEARQLQSKPQLKLLHKQTEQTHIALGFHGFKRDDSLKHAQGLLHVILGANMSSRLFNELREKKGLAYEIGTQIKRFEDTGAFLVHAGIDNRKVTHALAVILKELEKVKHKLVSVGEFKRAKEFYLGQLELALEDTMDHMLWIGESTATLDKTYSLADVIKEVGKVRREDILGVAKNIFQEKKLNLALIGPLKDSEKIIYDRLRLK
ncbi:MAG: peptidase M16 [Candidatus Omnitrophica bacterium CG23_combo_of_CG06-09_8_20_14_all_40_11]|nr:MAG: peptidase M16 [Candidatus Omnitrophica bacterium CG23_combo_of_CG06-09_8_20_14_all_40_11]